MSDFNAPIVFKRRTFAMDDGKGNSVAEWTLTRSSITDPVQLVAQPICTVPIIFVPGIMGSNLMATVASKGVKQGESVWLMNSKAGAAWDWANASAKRRQVLLNPATTDVYAGGDVPSRVSTVGDAEFIGKQRYWGEVGAMSYESFLVWLEGALNKMNSANLWRGQLGKPSYASAVDKGLSFAELTESDVGHAASIRYPVYVCGYNWLKSNIDSAERLKTRIKAVMKANNSKSYTCTKVILVTHSMGGLVARACSELLDMKGVIAGIVHGVMPATGAAVAYKRVRTGTEGSAGIVIGGNAAKVTAVFANAPGALQLLPSQDYAAGWLQLGTATLQGGGKDFKTVVSLPQPGGDPYEQIYKQRDKWWGLVREELINPADIKKHQGWDAYLTNINKAQSFHKDLSGRYHPNTWAFYGNGNDEDNGQTWGTVKWEGYQAKDFERVRRFGAMSDVSLAYPTLLKDEMLSLRASYDNGDGRVDATNTRQEVRFRLSGKDSKGDGTVPEMSGAAPAKAGARMVYHLNLDAEGHEGAYRIPEAQQLTLHAILSIARDIPIVV